MLPRWNRLWALLCLFLVIQLVSAESFRIAYRRDDKASSQSTTVSESATKERKATGTADSSGKATDAAESTGKDDKSKSVTATTTTKAKATKDSQPTATSTIISGDGTLDNSTFVNVTIANGQLPLHPEITPGWGVAGVIMLLSGLTYSLIGIKNRWIHTFFSTAYVGALGVAVLIVYVMNVPVNNGLQGGYVVAVVVSGCALGAASIFFREILEGLGCALGGFCVSMWLMCLVPGGLLKSVAPKAIFISCFTLTGFAFYCTRYTRDWALIVMISFTGATVTVLGIDCFSRAGLKEFWAWVWDLNDNLFPLGADTYPVTKGIRVETAAIIIIFLIGVVSQIKLWKIVREQRQKRAEEAAQDQRNLQEEEENVGRNIEEANARERRQWERTYGNGEGSSTVSRNSEAGDEVGEKKLRSSHTGSSQRQSSIENIEMTDMAEPQQPPRPAAANLMATEHDMDGRVTVRVAQDDFPRSPSVQEMDEKVADDQSSTFVGLEDDRRVSRATHVSQSLAPEVVPLPFVVPATDDARSEAERSSVATFADDDEGQLHTPGARHSLAQRLSRLSHGSAELLRSLSQRSGHPHGDFSQDQYRSTDDLVIPISRPHDDDGSMAATVDDESVSVGDRDSLASPEASKNIEITAQLSDRGVLSPSLNEQTKLNDVDAKSITNRSRADRSEEPMSEAQGKAKSVASAASTRVSLTKDRLPRSLSRVALSYRTNEWAKHLSTADAPDLEEIHISEPSAQESPAPVYVQELQKSAGEGTPAPAVTRSDSQLSNMPLSVPKRGSKQNVPAALAILTGDGQNRSPGTTPTSAGMPRLSSSGLRRTSGGGFEPIAEEHDAYVRATPPIPEEAEGLRNQSTTPSIHLADAHRSATPGLVSYSSPQTLIGQREMVLRNKSQGNLVASTSDLNLYRGSSDAGSLHNYAMYASGVGADADDLPLSQRKQLMRHSSLNPTSSTPSLARLSGAYDPSSADIPFDSHQPQRVSTVPTTAAREAALSHFRQTVAHDLRSGTPVINTPGRETPFAPMSLLGSRETEVQRNIEMGRNILMGQKEAEAQRREKEQRQKEWNDRVFDERMRTGDLLEVHREAMRKMQKHAKN
ncbi:hypothetical protein EDB80DRAFT_47726 [Ilyonectria destructans]|nr:hypothetical protein EDB80DRAFT_47726 [Ilyonectria destructans]